jgi:hypothetical protein
MALCLWMGDQYSFLYSLLKPEAYAGHIQRAHVNVSKLARDVLAFRSVANLPYLLAL